jgi:uncharacterized membrane protein
MSLSEQAPRKVGLGKMASTVMASFLGIRRRSDYDSDAASMSLKQVIIAGLIGGIVFVVGVILLVKMVLANLTNTG